MMMQELRIRKATVDDILFLFRICENQTLDELSLWGADLVYQYPPLLKQMQESFLSRKNTVLFAAECGGEIVGFAEITKIDEILKTGVLARIVLDPERRGKGIGRTFIQEIMKYSACELGLETISLIVYVKNVRAQRCYESCGFQNMGLLIRPGKPDAYKMEVSLK